MLEVFDPIYGKVDLPEYLGPFLSAPEFKRLSGIRLLNFESIALAGLSEVRRLSHTLGVLHLATRLGALRHGPDEIKALLIAVIMHDVGTPPFGHTIEYEFIRRYQKNHEEITVDVLNASHNRFNVDHQIFGGKTVRLFELLPKSGLGELVKEILQGTHPLSLYLANDIDIDNIDNVYRMAMFLGRKIDRGNPVKMATLLDYDDVGRRILAESNRAIIEDWHSCRKFSYERLLETSIHRQKQTIFSRLICAAMDEKLIDQEDWFLTDDGLLGRLAKERPLKTYFLDLDRDRQMEEFSWRVSPEGKISRNSLMDHRDALVFSIEQTLNIRCYVSLFDFGAAAHRLLNFFDPNTGLEWFTGSKNSEYRLHVYLASHPPGLSRNVFGRELEGLLRSYAESNSWGIFGSGRRAAAPR